MINDGEDGEEDNDDVDHYYKIDESYQKFEWEKYNPNGITWGDFAEAIMITKGSKSDWWYELICGVDVTFVDKHIMCVFLSIDHGS